MPCEGTERHFSTWKRTPGNARSRYCEPPAHPPLSGHKGRRHISRGEILARACRMRRSTLVYAFCIGLLASVCAAQTLPPVRQSAEDSVAVRVVDKTSRYCWIELNRPRHHAEARLVARGYRPIEAGARYRMRIEVTGERSEPFFGHVRCEGFVRVIFEPYEARPDTVPLMARTVPIGASNEWPDFNMAVLHAIDTVIGEF